MAPGQRLQAASFKLQAADQNDSNLQQKEKSYKPQASSLTAGPGDDRMDLERNNYGHNTIKKNSRRSGGDLETSKARYGEV